jgi:branched-subunit amino acid transport protein
MSEDARLIAIVFAMAVVTYLPRALPLHFDVGSWPRWISEALDYLPVSIIAAIVIPTLMPHEATGTGFRYAELAAAVPTALCARLTRNLLASVVLGTAIYLLLT